MEMLSQKKRSNMDIVDGLTLGAAGILLTIAGFMIAFYIATYEDDKPKLDKDNPIYKFWKDFNNKR